MKHLPASSEERGSKWQVSCAGMKQVRRWKSHENKIPTSQQDIQCPLKTTFLFRFLSTYFLTSCSFFFFKNKTKPKKKRYFYANYRTLYKGWIKSCFVQSHFDILLQPLSLTRERTKKSQQLAFNKDSKNESWAVCCCVTKRFSQSGRLKQY